MHFEGLNLQALIVFLVAAGVAVPLLRRFQISPVLGFLITGLIIGPYGLARFDQDIPFVKYFVIGELEGVQALAELGVVFLLFLIGLELSWSRLWALRRMVFGLGGSQVVITGTVIALFAYMFGNSAEAAVILGAGLALSSTAIVMQLLIERDRLGTSLGQTSFSILLFQDLAVLPILFLIRAFGAQAVDSPTLLFFLAMCQALVAVLFILILGRFVIRPLFRTIGASASREMFLAFVFLVIVGVSATTEAVGLSVTFGAFLAGLLFAETDYRHEIEVDIEPFKGLLMGLFFISVGMSVDLSQVAKQALWIAASVIGLFAIKGLLLYHLIRAFGKSRSVASEAAILLGQGGEFAFLVVGLALSEGLIPDPTAQFMLIITSITMFATPIAAGVTRRLVRLQASPNDDDPIDGEDLFHRLSGHTVIIGYGRVGSMLSSVLESREIPHVSIDLNRGLVAKCRKDGAGVYYGDGKRADVVNKFRIDKASSVVITINDRAAAEQIVQVVREVAPSLPIFARAHDLDHAARLVDKGADHVIPEATEACLQLTELALIEAGLPDRAAHHLVEARRVEENIRLNLIGGGPSSD
mgnify:FL=1